MGCRPCRRVLAAVGRGFALGLETVEQPDDAPTGATVALVGGEAGAGTRRPTRWLVSRSRSALVVVRNRTIARGRPDPWRPRAGQRDCLVPRRAPPLQRAAAPSGRQCSLAPGVLLSPWSAPCPIGAQS